MLPRIAAASRGSKRLDACCPGCGATFPVTIRGPRLPDEPWELTAPESYLLRSGLGWDVPAVSAFKLGLMDLVARRALTLKGAWVRRRWAPGTHPVYLLSNGPRKASVDEPALLPIIELHSSMIERRPSFGVPFDDPTSELAGVPLDKFVSAAARRNGGYAAYKKRDVAGSLRNRKLLSETNRRSPAGEQAWLQLDAWLELSQGPFKNWIHDQTWLRAYLAGAGTAVLLAEIANPGHKVLQQIGLVLASEPPTDQPYAVASDGWDTGGLDFAAIPESLDGGFDGAFAALDGAFLGGGGGGDGGGG
jgi:hypothetical protein